MTVLLSGATTPLGLRLTETLLSAGHETVLAVGIEPSAPAALERNGVHYARADLSRRRDVQSLMFGVAKDLGVECVVHTAFHRNPRLVGRNAHQLHVEGTRELLHHAERHPSIRSFVYLSHADVYRIDPRRAALISEEHPLELDAGAPQRVRDRVEADLTVCTRMGLSEMRILVLRTAELLAPDSGSQLHDYLRTRLCLRPLGFDPMLNIVTLPDVVDAIVRSVESDAEGVFNIPGADTLTLSRVVELAGRRGVPVPGPLLAPLYRARASTLNLRFSYDLNHRRFHFSAVLDGSRARAVLGYEPRHPFDWSAAYSTKLS